ncbi:MAG TPA: sialate O-acetylesterase [Burkholderiaceae bacterium]|nr:sialate O-acetylesterase [Burkholderiaceae bacterium]
MRRRGAGLGSTGAGLLLLALARTVIAGSGGGALLAPIFQDHMVLQRGGPVAIWGRAAAGESVSVSFAGATVRAQAGPSGDWRTSVEAGPGGPYTLDVRSDSGSRRTVDDVLVGDVYLCSGQSNMEMPVKWAANAAAEIATAGNPAIRMVTIPQGASAEPQAEFAAAIAWQPASPATVGDWSAACYFFARELQPKIGVPVGLVSAAWGGSNIRPWISARGLSALPGYANDLQILALYARDPAAAQQRFGEQWEQWWRARSGDRPGAEPWSPRGFDARRWRAAPAGLGDYQSWGVPELEQFLGMLWYRTVVRLTAAQAGQAAWLDLGGVDEVDETWMNGRAIGNSFGYGTERSYRVPEGVLLAGDNTLVVNVLNTYAGGGLVGDPAHRALRFANGERVPLDGEWRYQPVAHSIGSPHRAPWESVGGLATLFNGMIAPLGSFGLRGVVWYQGESNTGEADAYEALLASLMADWRRQFGAALSFLVVQLPDFGARVAAPTESGWAGVREAQRRAVAADPHAALIVTIDIGDPSNLHPPDKQDVGRRAALAARKTIYGESIAAVGPTPQLATRDGAEVRIQFRDDGDGLVTYSQAGATAFELCGDAAGSCRFVDARVDGMAVRLMSTPQSAATRVRYCWGDSPLCNLFDRAGLPAGPFELPVQPMER